MQHLIFLMTLEFLTTDIAFIHFYTHVDDICNQDMDTS